MTDLKRMEANGLQFAYLEEGEGPLVLLCHGFPDTAYTWDDLRPRLAAAGYRAVSPFMRGYAPTEASTTPTDAVVLGRDVIGWLDALGEDRAIIIGHDWGAIATYAATLLAPERFVQAFAIDVPHPGAQKPTLGLLWRVRHFVTFNLPGAARRLRANNFATIDELYRRWSPSWDISQEDVDRVKASLAPPGAAETALGYYRMLRSGKPDPIFDEKIEVPTIGVACRDHGLLPPSAFEAAAKFFEAPYEATTLPGGHFAHREHPDEFAELVLSRLGAV